MERVDILESIIVDDKDDNANSVPNQSNTNFPSFTFNSKVDYIATGK